jgi:two-component system chemotaxis sensor kinase CheA
MGSESSNPTGNSGSTSSDDLSEYLQVFLDETSEELDSLVESILQLEGNPRNSDALNKAFRMLHSLKGSCGMMGFEIVGDFAHKLEDRFESYRSGKDLIDQDTATLVLKCVDYFRDFVSRLRSGDASEGDPSELLKQLLDRPVQRESAKTSEEQDTPKPVTSNAVSRSPGSDTVARPDLLSSGGIRIKVKFKQGLQLADLKARLIVSRLSSIGEVVACDPKIEDVRSFEDLPLFSLTLLTDRKLDEIRKIAKVDGVESIELEGNPLSNDPVAPVEAAPSTESIKTVAATIAPDPPSNPGIASVSSTAAVASVPSAAPMPSRSNELIPVPVSTTVAEPTEGKSPVSETLRIDIERLDRLMNLTGELVVTNARFAQITAEMSPVFRRNSVFNKSKDLTERLRQRFEFVRHQIGEANSSDDRWHAAFAGLEEELEGLDEQSAIWDEGHRHFLEITEAVDQLTRVSKNLQRGVLNTRMVPVGPLLNRFKRVIRDLSVEREKRVQLLVHGENTELDRRMIDSLGDPLLHLVRNSIDHGLETIEQRRASGKPETGTISIEASHRGNNVLITVRDDGAGISIDKIRSRVVSRGIATESQVRELSEQQIVDFIWHPGFSTAEQVTDISGRGVGMDIVRSAISNLSGTIDVSSVPGQGTTFTIRLPLTLAIIRSLLIRYGDGHFSIPIDDVREIVSVSPDKIHAVHRHKTIDVRGELISLASMDNIFDWNLPGNGIAAEQVASNRNINVVLLHSRGKTLGLCVDALVGRADIVIKSLSENFVAIRGLSGASIMGDGTVCLMLDCTSLIELASERAAARVVVRR